jgi:hypothetical protein
MFSQIAWGLCNMAFEASRDRCFPSPMRRMFRQFGVGWYWIALAIEGRAAAILRDMRAEKARSGTHPSIRLGTRRSTYRGGCFRLLRRAHIGLRAKLRRWVREPWPVGARPEEPAKEPANVPAWSLPDSAKGLGLGQVWVVLCPFCRGFHTHLRNEGNRAAPCARSNGTATYALAYAGELPSALREQFRLSMRGDWPKVLLDWPRHDGSSADLRAA